MRRLIGILIAFCIIITGVTLEVVFTNKYIEETSTLANEIKSIVNETNFTSEEIKDKVDNLHEKWEHHEDILCMITDHNNIKDVGQQIVTLQASIQTQDYDDFIINLNLIIYTVNNYTHIFGINFHNLLMIE